MREAEHPTIKALAATALDAARIIAEPVQAHIVASDERALQVKWLGIAYESISFFIIFATRMARAHAAAREQGIPQAQLIASAMMLATLPEIATRFFSKNPREQQDFMLEQFRVGHHHTETDYAQCRMMFPERLEQMPESLVGRFAYSVVTQTGNVAAHAELTARVFDDVRGERGASAVFAATCRACDALPR